MVKRIARPPNTEDIPVKYLNNETDRKHFQELVLNGASIYLSGIAVTGKTIFFVT